MEQFLQRCATVVAVMGVCLIAAMMPRAAAQTVQTQITQTPISPTQTVAINSASSSSSFLRAKSGASDDSVRVAQLQHSIHTTTPGVSPATLTLGTLAPVHGANAEEGEAVKAVLTAYFADLNQRGGIHNRRITLRFADAGPDRATTVRNATQLLHQPIFAFVAPFAPGAEGALAGLAHEKKVPLAGMLALSVPDDPANREVFYLLPGFEQLVQELGRFAVQKQSVAAAKSAVVFGDRSQQQELGTAMQAMWKESGAAMPAEYVSPENPAELVKSFKAWGIDTVFLFAASDVVTPWIKAADDARWYPKLFLLGPLLDDSVLTGPAPLQGRMFAVYPALEPNLQSLSEFDKFLERHNLSGEHRLLLMSAYCAAEVLQTALTRAGKNPTRENLLLALEQMHDFRTGLFPPITFGPDRRIGSHKAEFVCLDLLTHSFEPTCSEPVTQK